MRYMIFDPEATRWDGVRDYLWIEYLGMKPSTNRSSPNATSNQETNSNRQNCPT